MKEVERVSLGGYAFTFEKEAAASAQKYLNELEKHYKNREGGAEILEGIEERMAELLQEKCGREGVVSTADIEDVMRILGKPEDIDTEGEAEQKNQPRYEEGPRKRLYRNLNDKVVAGVCSGLGTYLNVDPALFRILFAVFTALGIFTRWHVFFFVPVLTFPILYVILWISMPPAKTVQQRWEQRGEDGTLNGIQRSIENGAKEVDEAVRRVASTPAASEFGRIFEKLVGVILLIVAFSVLFTGGMVTFGTGLFGGHGFFGLGDLINRGINELRDVAPSVASTLVHPWVHILTAVVIFLPFLGILYGALQLLFGFKSPKWHPGLVIFVLWLMSLLALAILVVTGVVSTQFLTI